MEGIFELDGDKLKIGFSVNGPKGNRPRAFDNKETIILHLKRQKR